MKLYITLALLLIIVGMCSMAYVEYSRMKHWVNVEKQLDDQTNGALKMYDDSIAKERRDIKENINGKADNSIFKEQLLRMISERETFLNSRKELKENTKSAIVRKNIWLK
jgi:hypothetical protein